MITIGLPHKVADYACPINGFEDQYEWKTGRRLPGYFLMDLSSIGFIYIRQKRAPAPRMVFWGNGMGRAQHEFLSDLIGYRYTCQEGKSFKTAWQTAKSSLAEGTPVIIGLLDMYHLPYYPKFYHRVHIPQHFVLLVGYDESREVALVQDNGLSEIQSVPLEDLRLAWNVNNPGQGKPNTLYILHFDEKITDLPEIVENGLKKRANLFLNPSSGMMGWRGMQRAQTDFSRWADELNETQWRESLRSLATFTCSVVPNLPQRLLPYPLGYKDAHQAIRDRFAAELEGFSGVYDRPKWARAAGLLRASGEEIGALTDMAVNALLEDTLSGSKAAFAGASEVMGRILSLECEAFALLL